jgi:8-oxo-dGTP pyrophosphatase MutT (NUDIX family)
MQKDGLFYIAQKAFIKKGNEVLVLGDPEEGLDYPGGKIQEGEIDSTKSLQREVMEETGLEISVGEPFVTWLNVFPENHHLAGKQVFLVGYKCEYISGEVTLSHEHNSFSWVNKDNFTNVDDGSSFFEILKKYYLD